MHLSPINCWKDTSKVLLNELESPEEVSPDRCTLMAMSSLELQKPLWLLEQPRANVWEQNGIKLDTKLTVYSYIHVRLDSTPISRKKTFVHLLYIIEASANNKVSKQYNRQKFLKKARMQ